MNHVPMLRSPLLKTVGHQDTPPERFQPFIQTFILEYNAQNKNGWFRLQVIYHLTHQI